MIIKKFTGKNEIEATEEARKELGPNIVVMNVRPVKRTGLFAFLKPQKTEVTVALEEESERTPSVSSRPAAEDAGSSTSGQVIHPTGATEAPLSAGAQLAKIAAEGKIPQLKVNASTDNGVVYRPSAEGVRESARGRKDENSILEEKLDSLHNLLEQNIMHEGGPAREDVGSRDSDKKTALELLSQSRQAPEPADQVPEELLSFIKLLYNTLLENEVDERYANELTDEVEKISKPNLPFEMALASVYQKMVLKFGKPEVIGPSANGGPKGLIFIGPTGVGKTTTIAKLASMLSVTWGKKVALLTVDTYRIAAAEQLRMYASILQIPFRVIYSTEEMKQAADDFRDYDYIMVDTAGHSLHNEEQKKNVENFIRALEAEMECDDFLVLSATTKYRDLLELADAYSEMVHYRLIFTKMDETRAIGNLYNIRMHTGAPMSYITNGQNVPDDIEEFDAQRIVKGLLGGSEKAKG